MSSSHFPIQRARLRFFGALLLFLQSVGFCGGATSIFDDPTALPSSPPPRATPKTVPATTPSATGTQTPAAPVAPVPPAPAENSAAKIAPPDAASKAKLLKFVKQIYAKEYADKSPVAKRELAAAMVTEADKIQVNFSARYVLLQEAEMVAIAATDVADTRKAIEGITKNYSVDASALTMEALTRLWNGGADDAKTSAWALQAIEDRMNDDDYSGARQILRAISTKIEKTNDRSVRAKEKSLETALAEYERIRPAMARLKTDPGDAAANLAVGRFLCFSKHDWANGLPLLCKGNDPKLKSIAQQDVANPAEVSEQYDLGGKWWDLGEGKIHTAMQISSRDRAVYWYEKALPNLSALQKVLAEKRIAEAANEGETSANLVKQLVLDGNGNRLPDGSVELKSGSLKLPAEIKVPFRADAIVKATSSATSVRLNYSKGILIFNWEDNPSEFRYHSPATGAQHGFKGKGAVPVGEFIHITWVITQKGSQVLVDGEERGSDSENYDGISGNLFFSIWAKPGVVVKSMTVTLLSEKHS